ncbi:MAG: hypothetical protein GTO46_10870 [Gemmatimonadetes bacterium]|nr:hypothetical protein [Gemmatimonadota bacterium]NIO32106.1 hypothetical protein [Gemmatimonadota bacterium]
MIRKAGWAGGLRVLRLAGLIVTLLLAAASPQLAQSALRRGAPVQALALAKNGDLLVGFGAAYEENVMSPLVAVEGDLTRVGVLQLSWAIADRVVLEFHGDAYRALTIDNMGRPPVEPDEGLADGKSTGAGNLCVGISVLVLGDAEGFGLGGRFQFHIPSSNQAEGLGSNTTDVSVTLLGSYGSGPLIATADAGIAILEAPLENFEQNDVIAYNAEVLYSPVAARPLRLFAGVTGRASVRSRVPVGTEDLGELLLGADYRLGRWLIDTSGFVGYAGNSAAWGIRGGVAALF